MAFLLLELEIDGADFNGTQIQAYGRTVQGLVTEAIGNIDAGSTFRLGSRLDQGVSARGLTGLCRTNRDWDPVVFGLALNQHLPVDIVVVRVARVSETFDPLRAACIKHYRYTVLVRPVRPVVERRCWWVRDLKTLDVLNQLAALIPGTHDLSGFACLRHDETDFHDPVREYISAVWSEESSEHGRQFIFRIAGRGFLYKQIRGLVGGMVSIAQGRFPIEAFATTMQGGRNAPRLGNIAPAEGLRMDAVCYDEAPPWIEVCASNRGLETRTE
jgi:tRNA pseudouridine38-40 synthase